MANKREKGGRVEIRLAELISSRGLTIYRVAKNSGITYQALHNQAKGEFHSITGEVLFRVLIDGMGLSIEEAQDLYLGDLFRFVPNGDNIREGLEPSTTPA